MDSSRRPIEPVTPLHEVEKVVEFFLLFAAYLYIASNEAARGVVGHHLDTALDRALPFSPLWVHVYDTLWVFVLAPFLFVRSNRFYRPFFAGMAGTLVGAYVIYIGFPTQMILRPSIAQTPGFSAWLLRLVYLEDAPYNCFPSMHVALSQLAAWSIWELDRVAGRVAFGLAFLIALSALFLKQHYIVDVFGGTIVALVAHHVTLGAYARKHRLREGDRRSRWVLVGCIGLQLALVLFAWVEYRLRG